MIRDWVGSTLLMRFCLTLCLGCSLVSCGETQRDVASHAGGRPSDVQLPIQITATVGMVADLVRQVGGDRVAVTQLCGPGVDPHLYKATRDDVQSMMSADMIFYSGLMLEGKLTDTLVKVARSKPVVAVTESLDESVLLQPENLEGHFDPHVWMDVSAWSKCTNVIHAALVKHDPEGADLYQANRIELQTQLAGLDEYAKRSLGSIPAASRTLVTSHDAFNYFGRAYGLDVVGVQGISTESEAGLQQVNDLVKRLVDQQVDSVFVESSVPRKSIEALVEGAKAKGHEVKIGDKELFSDAMGRDGTYEGTYIGMLDHNVTLVTRGLGGDAPEGGMQGKLAR